MQSKSGSEFSVTAKQLRELMEFRGAEAVTKLEKDFGGQQNLCKLLKTDQNNGIPNDPAVLELRRKTFGSNVTPPKPPKTFCQHVCHALQDTTLIILEIAAAISLVLSLYSPPEEEGKKIHPTEAEEEHASWIEGAAILVSVFIVVFITAINDYEKEKQFRGKSTSSSSPH